MSTATDEQPKSVPTRWWHQLNLFPHLGRVLVASQEVVPSASCGPLQGVTISKDPVHAILVFLKPGHESRPSTQRCLLRHLHCVMRQLWQLCGKAFELGSQASHHLPCSWTTLETNCPARAKLVQLQARAPCQNSPTKPFHHLTHRNNEKEIIAAFKHFWDWHLIIGCIHGAYCHVLIHVYLCDQSE